MNRLSAGVAACLLLVSLVGCGNESTTPTGDVSGTVTYENEPVTEGSVQFAPVGDGYFASAEIGSDGTYTVRTQDGGLPPGEYRVTVIPPTIMTPDTAAGPGSEVPKEVDNIPAKYRNPDTSSLAIQVDEGNQTFDISMTE